MSLILRKKGYDQWACIAPKGKEGLLHISWGSIQKASVFDDEKALQESFSRGIEQMEKAAQKKADGLNAKGGVVQKLEGFNKYQKEFLQQNTPYEEEKDFKSSRALSLEVMCERIVQRQQEEYPGVFGKKDDPVFQYYNAPDLNLFKGSGTTSHYSYTARARAHIQAVHLSDLSNGRVTHPEVVRELFAMYGFVMRASQPQEHLPQWFVEAKRKGIENFFQEDLLIEGQAHAQDFLQTQETYFVRSPMGWLGLKKGSYTFLPQMQQAYMFFDIKAARAAVQNALDSSYGRISKEQCAIVKNQLVISKVEGVVPESKQWMSDLEAAEISSGCEALAIEEEISKAVAARKSAYEKSVSPEESSLKSSVVKRPRL